MFCYLTSYRFYTLSKIGFGLAYLWFIWDFYWIHVSFGRQMFLLMPDPGGIAISGDSSLDAFWRTAADLLGKDWAIFFFVTQAPLIVALYLWGLHRWVQFGVGCMMSISMIAMTSCVGVFDSTADVWLNYIFLTYAMTALVCPSRDWENREPGLGLAQWREDPVVASTYAWCVVLVQFTVYFFAGINKLADGWTPWITGTAIQNLSFDSSMHDYARGVYVPYWLSLILCYTTLFQRLVVPFGFFLMRYRGWAVLILGAMHAGYDILMQVAVFPLIGVASLLIIIPPRTLALPLFSRLSIRQPRASKRLLRRPSVSLLRVAVMSLFAILLLGESARLTLDKALPWENKLMIVPAWRMFADGGITSGGKWRIILQTPEREVDMTDEVLRLLPHLWRDRFYIDEIQHAVSSKNRERYLNEPDSLVGRLISTSEQLYLKRQHDLRDNPAILGAQFEILSKSGQG